MATKEATETERAIPRTEPASETASAGSDGVRPVDADRADRARRVQRLKQLTKLMDGQFRVPGIDYRVGLDGLIGLVPGAGDLITTGISLYIIYEAYRLNVPKWKLGMMALNVGIDFLAGSIPVVGDLFDFAFKANERNLRLIGIRPS